MKAYVYFGDGHAEWIEKSIPEILYPTDVIVQITRSCYCKTDLLKSKLGHFEIEKGLVLGHEGYGVVTAKGNQVQRFEVNDLVIIKRNTACKTCQNCHQKNYFQCLNGGQLLGYSIDGTLCEFARIPYADGSLTFISPDWDKDLMEHLTLIFDVEI